MGSMHASIDGKEVGFHPVRSDGSYSYYYFDTADEAWKYIGPHNAAFPSVVEVRHAVEVVDVPRPREPVEVWSVYSVPSPQVDDLGAHLGTYATQEVAQEQADRFNSYDTRDTYVVLHCKEVR